MTRFSHTNTIFYNSLGRFLGDSNGGEMRQMRRRPRGDGRFSLDVYEGVYTFSPVSLSQYSHMYTYIHT